MTEPAQRPSLAAPLPTEIVASLQRAGLIGREEWTAEPLSGGVSSDIHVVRPRGRTAFVVKRALPRLRVSADWQVDPRRNRIEHLWLKTAAGIVPGCVPAVLFVDDDVGFFVMEHVDAAGSWKDALLSGSAEVETAHVTGTILGRLHAATWSDCTLRETFATDDLFCALRIDPYLLATAEAYPTLRCHFEDAARQLMKSRACLVHGDYSPKNILVSGTRTVVVDAEVGWFGDPAFDLAFMLNHFYLKSLLGPPAPGKSACLQLANAFQRAHAMSVAHLWKPEFEAWVTRLLLMLMLARVDGKSPVQYLRPAQQEFIRRFVSAHLNGAPGTLAELEALWTKHLVEHAYQ